MNDVYTKEFFGAVVELLTDLTDEVARLMEPQKPAQAKHPLLDPDARIRDMQKKLGVVRAKLLSAR